MIRRYKLLLIPALVLLFSGFMNSDSDIYFKMSKGIDIFGKIYKEIAINYVDDIDPEIFMLSGIKGMLDNLDPYTVYIDENMQNDIDVITKGKYGGIGATVGLRNGKITIVDLVEGYSGQRQGARIGDVIIEVDDTEFNKDNYDELGSFLKGEPGTIVKVKIEREGMIEPLIFNFLREEIEVNNLTYYGFVPAQSHNVYLKLSGFTRTAGEEVKKAILELKEEKEIQSIILDLRGNPGGLLDAAIDVSEKFLSKGQLIVSVIGRDSTKIQKYYSSEEPVAGDAKLIVLVDNGSASASEIVAGAIQDHDRGVILGVRSFGKGLVQTLIPLSYNTSLKITTAKYYTPSGRCIQSINYSEDNKVFSAETPEDSTTYMTDNQRKVFAGGGIEPDTLVSNESESNQVTDLLARGFFFKFATYFYNLKPIESVDDIDEDKLLNSFIAYLDEQDFNFKSKPEKLLEQLKETAVKSGYNPVFIDKLNELEKDIIAVKTEELKKYKSDTVSELKNELASRISGRDGRIVESLKHDRQFDAALKILGEEVAYNTLLSFMIMK